MPLPLIWFLCDSLTFYPVRTPMCGPWDWAEKHVTNRTLFSRIFSDFLFKKDEFFQGAVMKIMLIPVLLRKTTLSGNMKHGDHVSRLTTSWIYIRNQIMVIGSACSVSQQQRTTMGMMGTAYQLYFSKGKEINGSLLLVSLNQKLRTVHMFIRQISTIKSHGRGNRGYGHQLSFAID